MKRPSVLTSLSASVALIAAVSGPLAAAPSTNADRLAFDPNAYTEKSVTVDGHEVRYRAYEGISYVAQPVDPTYQTINVFVPVEYYEGKSVHGYTAETAPIFLPNTVGGYMPGRATSPGASRAPAGMPEGMGRPAGAGAPPAGAMPGMGKRTDSLAAALARGYVVASPGVRGRTLKAEDGSFTGKAPAFIVDLKAAVRYLRHNDRTMPGDAEKIISNGTSAGGALSALIGATGNSADYEPYLKALGAAEARDDIFAASCYCPITNLDHADAAYEWLFQGVNTYVQRGGGAAPLTAEQIAVSEKLAPTFPGYVNSLGLRTGAGAPLTLDAQGNGSFKDLVKHGIVNSAQAALKQGTDLSKFTWLTIKDGTVTDVDLPAFIAFATRMKTPPAFDSLTLASPETNVFGTATVDSQHFTPFARDNSTDHTLADAQIIKMMNPMNYIGTAGATTAKYWRIRHGAVDRDTSLAIPTILATKLSNSGKQVDFAFPWGRGHSGDYDLDELFAWVDALCQPKA